MSLLAGLAAGLASDPAAAAPKVVASITPVHSLIANVMAGVAEPELLVRGAASPHAYSLRPSDARRLAQADLVFWIGPALETSLEKPLRALAARAQIVTLAQIGGITLLPVRPGGVWPNDTGPADAAHEHDDEPGEGAGDDHAADHGHEHGDGTRLAQYDPHLWLDPHNAERIVSAAVAFLSAADPANAAHYADNGAATLARLAALDSALKARLKSVQEIPYVIFHDAYQYFERHYGLAAIGAITLSPERSPSIKRLRAVRAAIVETGAVCVFSEPQFAPALVRTVIEGTAARVGVLDPLGGSLTPGPDAYFAFMHGLADDLVACLAPVNGG